MGPDRCFAVVEAGLILIAYRHLKPHGPKAFREDLEPPSRFRVMAVPGSIGRKHRPAFSQGCFNCWNMRCHAYIRPREQAPQLTVCWRLFSVNCAGSYRRIEREILTGWDKFPLAFADNEDRAPRMANDFLGSAAQEHAGHTGMAMS